MQFVHCHYKQDDVIAAIATPIGEGGVAIIRISGKDAINIAKLVFSGPVETYTSHTAHFGKIIDSNGNKVDEALVIAFHAPRSYTGENTVEIHCHGGGLITRRVLDVVLAAGARAALPGEFTYRAFMNGKLDLAQAEAVQELICAKNEMALNAAEAHLEGQLSKKIYSFQDRLTHIAAILEAWVDFPEEGLEFASMEEVCKELQNILNEKISLLSTFHDGRIIHDGLSLCLIGAPNVGKSSLMNALLNKNRAIVSDIPGTTRDLVEDNMRLSGLNFRLVDTAGIRQTMETIELEGIRRSQEALSKADLILLVLDAYRGISNEDLHLIDLLQEKKTLIIWNKVDLSPLKITELHTKQTVQVSAAKGLGLDGLKQAIDKIIWEKGPPSKEEVIITNVRHKEALEKAIDACRQLIKGLQTGLSPEFLMLDMRSCLASLGQIIGTDITEDILSAIFSTFCVGK